MHNVLLLVGGQGHMMWIQRQDGFKEKFGTGSDSATNP